MRAKDLIRWFDEISVEDVAKVGGKNSSLGEMFQHLRKNHINVPFGFATTSDAYFLFLNENRLKEKIEFELKKISDTGSLKIAGANIRKAMLKAKIPSCLEKEIVLAYEKLSDIYKVRALDVAVRSSATAEDLPGASFAGQQESFLNISSKKELLSACRRCYASLFTDRAISYRKEKGFDHLKLALSIGIQKMVRSDLAGSGVMFTIDTETGFKDLVIINAAFGLGENVVQGTVSPDEYEIFKPLLDQNGLVPIIEKRLGLKEKKLIYGKDGISTKNIATPQNERQNYVLSDREILTLARWAVVIEKHYRMPMDIEWAKDGRTKELYVVQARPETVQARKHPSAFKSFRLKEKKKPILEGLAIGEAISAGKAQVLKNPKELSKFKKGSILITETTSPDWVPIMKKAIGIITDHGGRTSHAAIVSRELGVPAIVGTNRATKSLKNGQEITLSCSEGEKGYVYSGILKYEEKELDLKKLPKIKTKIMINLAAPDGAFHWWQLPVQGVGLARMEFIINDIIKIHPMALIGFARLKDKKAKAEIARLTSSYSDKKEYFIDKLARSLSRIAASQYPYPVIVRMSDFKTNEYANLIGGKEFEPKEENPMLGFRGASRYYSDKYKKGFALECRAVKRAREVMGLKNIVIMIPFCRTIKEADLVLKALKENGLERKKQELQIYVMCEIPSNVILAEEFAKRFDGFSIGSNDLTQLTLGVDRDSKQLSDIFDERNEAVKKLISTVIKVAKKSKIKVGICGQGPSDHPDFAAFLIKEGIDSISLNPDSVIPIIYKIAKIERSNN